MRVFDRKFSFPLFVAAIISMLVSAYFLFGPYLGWLQVQHGYENTVVVLAGVFALLGLFCLSLSTPLLLRVFKRIPEELTSIGSLER